MEKSRSLAILILGLACLLMIACLTGGTPKQSGGTPTKKQATAGPQAPPTAKSASQKRSARRSAVVGSVASAQRKHLTGGALHLLGNLPITGGGQSIKTMRAIIYAALAAIFLVVLGATTTTRVRRHRKLTPSPLNARH